MITSSFSFPIHLFFWFYLILLISFLLLNKALSRLGIPLRVYSSILKKFFSLWVGLSIGLLYKANYMSDAYLNNPPVLGVWRLSPNGTLTLKENVTFGLDNRYHPRFDKPVIFITTTDYSPIEAALLTRLAQAIYPVRQGVKWIVVSLPLDTGRGMADQLVIDPDSNATITLGKSLRKNPELARDHLQSLDKLLNRFGIPYVLLTTSEDKSLGVNQWPKASRQNRGYQVGLAWAERYLSDGVIFMGNPHFAYNSILFHELQKTKIAACWTLALPPFPSKLPSVLLLFEKITPSYENWSVIGYNDGVADRLDSIIIERGAFAIDLQYLRENLPYKDLWKLSLDRKTTSEDLGLSLDEVQVIGGGERVGQILAWRTRTLTPTWPTKITVGWRTYEYLTGKNALSYNLHALLKNVFGLRYNMIELQVREGANDEESFEQDDDFNKTLDDSM